MNAPAAVLMMRPPDKWGRQEQVLRTLERLEQRDTQRAAAADLARLVRDLDANALGTLLHALSVQTSKTSQFARLKSLRVLALLTTPACPLRPAVLASPTFGKLLSLLLARLADGDSRVREAAAVACGLVAEQMQAHFGDEAQLTAGDIATNPLLRGIFEAIGEQNRDVQAAASAALARVVGWMQPLAPALLRQLLRALESPSFPARAELCPAIAHLPEAGDQGEVHGLVRSSLALVQAHIGLVVGGGQGGGGGLLAVLAAPEWQARKAAAEALQALAVALGPDWDGSGACEGDSPNSQLLDAVTKGLVGARWDKVKPVREAAQAALATFASLQQWVGRAGSERGPAAATGQLVATGDHCRMASPPATRPWTGAGDARCKEKGQALSVLHAPTDGVVAEGDGGSPVGDSMIAALKSPLPAPSSQHQSGPGGRLPATLQAPQAEQQRMAAALHLLTTSTAEALGQLQQQVQELQEAVATLQLAHGAPASSTPPAAAGVGPAQQSKWQPGAPPEPVACASPTTGACSPTARGRPGGSCATLEGLRTSHAELAAELRVLHSAGLAEPASPLAGGVGSNTVPEAGEAGMGVASSLEEVYSRLVADGGVANELKLLRTMARTGPAWEHLRATTAQALLCTLVQMLEGRSALAKIVPWLWPLADEGLSASFGMDLKLGLLRALVLAGEACPADDELCSKVSMLQLTLKAVWGITGAAA